MAFDTEQKITAHKRIAKNTMVLYIRMFFMTAVAIYTTRVVLEALGVVDYGIYNIVGGVIGFITMVTSALTLSVQRFLNFELGKGENGNVSQVFSAAVIIHLLFAICLFIILESAGAYYFKTCINIPPNRLSESLIVFHACSIAACLQLFVSPFTAVFISYERMDIFAYTSIIDVILKLAIVFILLLRSTGRLELYGLLMLGVTFIYILVSIAIWRIKFSEVKFCRVFNYQLFKQLTSFASWSAFGQLAWALTLQGINILLNIFFGNILNAAYGITSQVQAAVIKFVQSFQNAINPQIIKNYAKNDLTEVKSLIINGTKYTCYLELIIAVPLFFGMDVILKFWLTTVPEYTLWFCRLMLINLFIDTFSNLLAVASEGSGQIKKFQLAISTMLCLNFIITYFALKITGIPYMIYWVYTITSVILFFIRLRIISRQMKLPLLWSFIHDIIIPLALIIATSGILSYIIYETTFHLEVFPTLVIKTIICVLSVFILICIFGLKRTERSVIFLGIKNKILKRE